MGFAVNKQEDMHAECKREQAEYPTGDRDRTKDKSEGLEHPKGLNQGTIALPRG